MSSKKNLLAKLKKDIAKTKKTTPTTEESIRESNETHPELFGKVFLTENIEDLRNIIQTHVNFYPKDSIFLSLLDLPFSDIMQVFTKLKSMESFHPSVIKDIIKEYKPSTINEQDEDMELFNTLKNTNTFSIDMLIHLDEKVFDALLGVPFISQKYEAPYCKRLVDYLLENPPTNLKKQVDVFIYNNRYYEISELLQDPSVSSNEKQDFVVEYIKNQYENIKAKQFYIQLIEIVENKVSPFKQKLDGLLYRYIADKKFIPEVRKTLTIALDIMIHKNTTDKYLSKFFLTKAGLEKYKTNILPLFTNEKRYLKSIVRNEFQHSFLFENSEKIDWKTFLSILQNSGTSLETIESKLIKSIDHNRDFFVEKIQRLLESPETNLKNIRPVIHQFIQTFSKPNERKTLSRLLTSSKQQLVNFFNHLSLTNYIELCQDIQEFSPPNKQKEDPSFITKNTPMNLKTFEMDYRIFLEQHRLEIQDFESILIQFIGGKKEQFQNYTDRVLDDTYVFPNKTFFKDCVEMTYQQEKNILSINNIQVKVYYLMSKTKILQTDKIHESHLQFVKNQVSMTTASSPLEFFKSFIKTPILNHSSNFMKTLRSTQIKRFEEHDLTFASEIEESIYKHSSNLQTYVQSISRILLVADPIHSRFFSQSKYFKTILKDGFINIENIGEFLQLPLEKSFTLLFPEYFQNSNIQNILLQKAQFKLEEIFNFIVLRAFVMENPMARIPILPTSTEIFDKKLYALQFITDDTIMYGNEDDAFHLQPINESYLYDEIDRYFNETSKPYQYTEETNIVKEISSSTSVLVSDPLESFLDVAMDSIDSL
jgi:hypothetical protein